MCRLRDDSVSDFALGVDRCKSARNQIPSKMSQWISRIRLMRHSQNVVTSRLLPGGPAGIKIIIVLHFSFFLLDSTERLRLADGRGIIFELLHTVLPPSVRACSRSESAGQDVHCTCPSDRSNTCCILFDFGGIELSAVGVGETWLTDE